MSIDAAEIARLREIAENATPGPWWRFCENRVIAVMKSKGNKVNEVVRWGGFDGTDYPEQEAANAAHIAAFNPEASRALLAELEKVAERYACNISIMNARTHLLKTVEAERDEAKHHAAIAEFNEKECLKQISVLKADRDAAHTLLREAVPHIQRAMAPYKDGWIEEKADIISRIAKLLGDA